MKDASDNLPSIKNTKASPLVILGLFILLFPFLGDALGMDVDGSIFIWIGIIIIIFGSAVTMADFK